MTDQIIQRGQKKPRGTPAERFERFVDRSDKNGGCWVWTGYAFAPSKTAPSNLYGRFRLDRKQAVYAHRFAYELWKGPIPAGLTIDHTCRNTRCVNPAHLEAVTLKDNIMRGNGICARYARARRAS